MNASETVYRVSWSPIADVDAKARELGMKDDDGSSYWDWMDPSECERSREFPFWQPAVSFAKRVAKRDVFGAARLERLVKVTGRDHAGRFDHWDIEAIWDVTPGELGLSPRNPDQLFDEAA